MKTKTKFLLTSLVILSFSACANADFSWWGNPAQNSISIGSLAWHVQDTFGNDHEQPHYLVYPYVGVTYDSVGVMYFKNTYQRATVGVVAERNVYTTPLNQNVKFDFNYQLGALFGGYCIKSLSCDPPSPRVIPVLIPVARISYKDNAAVSVSVFGVVLGATFQYLF